MKTLDIHAPMFKLDEILAKDLNLKSVDWYTPNGTKVNIIGVSASVIFEMAAEKEYPQTEIIEKLQKALQEEKAEKLPVYWQCVLSNIISDMFFIHERDYIETWFVYIYPHQHQEFEKPVLHIACDYMIDRYTKSGLEYSSTQK